ncbi:MAG: ATP-binding cassette domain-containing protein [Gallintestinimicrobium sp.]
MESSRAQKRLEEWENASAPSAALPTRMEIEWRGVSFSYDKPVLKNVTARMDLTQNHIIRGENGAGKSTLIKLLLGMETPQSGDFRARGATGQLDKTLFPSEIFICRRKRRSLI